MAIPDIIQSYMQAVQKEFSSDIAREHAYRPALKAFLESFSPGVHAVNDAKQMAFGGAPDFQILDK